MSVEIRLPGVFARYTKGRKTVSTDAQTLQDALNNLVDEFPELKSRLFTPDQQLRQFINIYLNTRDVRALGEKNPVLRAGDSVTLIPAIAGG